ncbi:hypothetical protein CANARDRAFT_28960 [[Candida] arabinofermentans NRRL YB-2248]|uniref:WKF domain-containing protein n=1 Tax=[Candida] arabinofermentans NRRL YB-2248 TaxID=983967 RepID=A0A1E4SZ97_9ASCO|nr:hypothetical protein CANARDRAFT_28960 [[Candida] arabinofermentans NRRL YB-2248]
MTSIPAWKKAGLKIKQITETDDPLSLTTHIESSKLTNKQNKQVKRKQQQIEDATISKIKDKKPPKRQKLPKSERKKLKLQQENVIEKDQFQYLKIYTLDKTNWKFSKQKQNWILKNIKDIPVAYIEYLNNYVLGLQGGSKDRLINDMKNVVLSYNKICEDAERLLQEASLKEQEGEGEDKVEEEKPKVKSILKNSNKEIKDTADVISKQSEYTFDYAKRAQTLYELLTNEKIKVFGDDDEGEGKKGEGEMIVEEVEVSEYVEDADFE